MKFIIADIPSYHERIGDYSIAERLILTTDLSNEEIAIQSGISKTRIPPLRRKLRR